MKDRNLTLYTGEYGMQLIDTHFRCEVYLTILETIEFIPDIEKEKIRLMLKSSLPDDNEVAFLIIETHINNGTKENQNNNRERLNNFCDNLHTNQN